MTDDTVGPWRVRAEWDERVSRNGPVRVVIEPSPDAAPADLAGGISTTVLRRVRLQRDVEQQNTDVAVRRLQQLAKAGRDVTPKYLAALSEVYAMFTSEGRRAVSYELAELVDRAPSTVKAQLGEARRLGLLTQAVPHRQGGELTEHALQVLNGV